MNKKIFLLIALIPASAFCQLGQSALYSVVQCVGSPGNTQASYLQQCQNTSGLVYTCNNTSGCAVAADFVAIQPASTAVVNNSANTITTSGAASTPTMLFTGSYFTGGTSTTTEPFMLFQPTGATAGTMWSTGGTILGMNAPSGFTGNFLDIHLNNGNSILALNTSGTLTANGFSTGNGVTAGTQVKAKSYVGNSGTPAASVTGTGCALGTVTGSNPSGIIAVTGTGSACTVALTWSGAYYTNGASCGPLRDVTAGTSVQDTGAASAASTTFPALAMTTGDVLRYGPCIGY